MVDTTESSPSVTATVIQPIESTTQPAVQSVSKGETGRSGAETQEKTSVVARTESVAPTPEPPATVVEDKQPVISGIASVADTVDPLSVSKVCLCRKIIGFGSYEPLTESRVKPGQQILLYCEMTGMQFELKDESFVSRLSSKIEIGSVENGVVQWAHDFRPAVDVCASRRRDFFVNYKFSVPPELPPGSYRLRLTQSDLIANRSAVSEIPLMIVP